MEALRLESSLHFTTPGANEMSNVNPISPGILQDNIDVAVLGLAAN